VCAIERIAVPTTPPDLQRFAALYTSAWCSQNAASVATFFSPNGRLSLNDGAPAIGRSAIQNTVQSFMTAFPDLRVILDKLVAKDDRVEYHWTLAGTNTGPGGTGKPVRISGMEIWKAWSEGLIDVSEGEFDAADYQRQLGIGS
jgi:predicted ester cyclase